MKIQDIKKRGQIGTTLTWIVAFGLILFVLFLFLIITFSVSAGKSLKIVDLLSSYGKNEIDIFGEEVKTSDYTLNKEIYSIINEKVEYKGGKVRIVDLLRYYSYTKEEEIFHLFDSNMKNTFDALYNECYSFCFFINRKDGTKITQQIVGNKCTELNSPCISLENLPMGKSYKRGIIQEKNDIINYEIKLYIKGEDGK